MYILVKYYEGESSENYYFATLAQALEKISTFAPFDSHSDFSVVRATIENGVAVTEEKWRKDFLVQEVLSEQQIAFIRQQVASQIVTSKERHAGYWKNYDKSEPQGFVTGCLPLQYQEYVDWAAVEAKWLNAEFRRAGWRWKTEKELNWS